MPRRASSRRPRRLPACMRRSISCSSCTCAMAWSITTPSRATGAGWTAMWRRLNGPQARAIDRALERRADCVLAERLRRAGRCKPSSTTIRSAGAPSNYPPNSVRQIPGAFDKTPHTVAGRPLTLDQIETKVLAGFRDPAPVSGDWPWRHRRWAPAERGVRRRDLGQQLASVATEFATGGHLLDIDEASGAVTVTPIVSWRQADFIAAYASSCSRRASRSAARSRRRFSRSFTRTCSRTSASSSSATNSACSSRQFDWRLNDLSGGRP